MADEPEANTEAGKRWPNRGAKPKTHKPNCICWRCGPNMALRGPGADRRAPGAASKNCTHGSRDPGGEAV